MQQQKCNPGTGSRSRRHIQEELGSAKGEVSAECQVSEFALTRSITSTRKFELQVSANGHSIH